MTGLTYTPTGEHLRLADVEADAHVLAKTRRQIADLRDQLAAYKVALADTVRALVAAQAQIKQVQEDCAYWQKEAQDATAFLHTV